MLVPSSSASWRQCSPHSRMPQGSGAPTSNRGDILERCPICDAKIPSLNRWAHLDSEHPGEARRLKALTILAYGSFLGIFLGVIAVLSGAIVGIFPFGWGDLAHTLMFLLLLAWGAVFIPWGFLVERPHRAKVRAEWQATHFTVQTRPR